MVMRLFSILWLLLIGHFTGIAGSDWLFSSDAKQICPGQSLLIPRGLGLLHDNLYFESSKDSILQVANKTHIFLPFYQFKDSAVIIPVVMKQHEGEYFWSSDKDGIRLGVTQLILKDCSIHQEVYYGNVLTLMVPEEASILEFTPPKSSDRWVLWSQINMDNKRGARGVVRKSRWEAPDITHADAGRYAFLRESGGEISSTRLIVKEVQRYHDVSEMSIRGSRFPVLVSAAVLTFIDSSMAKHVLFQNSMVTTEAFQIFGSRIKLKAEFGELTLTIVDLKTGDTGKYEVRDKNNGLAVVMYVSDSNGSSYEDMTVPTSVVGVVGILVFCCCCLRKCHCKKNSASESSPGPQQPVYIHTSVGVDDFPPSVGSAGPWLQPTTSSAHSRDNALPSYDEVVPYPPYAPAVPLEASGGMDSFPPTVRNVGRQPWLEPNTSSTQSRDNVLPSYDAVMSSDSELHYPYSVAFPSEASAGGGGADAHPVPSAPLDPEPQYHPH